MNWKKRGVSTVVATVLIIMLTIAAAAILAGFLVPYVKNKLADSTECLNYRDYFQFKEEINEKSYNCYLSDRTKYGASIGAILNDEEVKIAGFNLIFTREDLTTKIIQVRKDLVPGLKMYDAGGSLGTAIEIPKKNEIYTYVHEDASKPKYKILEAAPVLKSGKVCDISDRIELKSCLGGVTLDEK